MRFLVLYVFLLCDKDNIRHTRTCLFRVLYHLFGTHVAQSVILIVESIILKDPTNSVWIRFIVLYMISE